jgi:GTP-binding protein EngB required for normal cell division
MPEDAANSLNANHERRLSVTCRHIDKLLSDMEGTLNASASKQAFPQYVSDLAPAQRRVIEDYITRIRAQLVRVLDGQHIERPMADIPVSRSLHAVLTFIDIAVEELKPEYMRGYGEVPADAAVELNGIAGELRGLVNQLDQYVTRGSREDLQQRLERLEQSGDEVALLNKLESIIAAHGLVEFRSTLSMILDRLEDNGFEIAIFGRVSSGKSSLLNAILETDILPVGVTPITAVPTRITYGKSPLVTVWFANRTPEEFDISRLPEFVAEQLNPGNEKHVTRILVRLASPRLEDGVIFVDTPGLGSLATRGAAETLAYLPRCDLGVVLIDAGSTLTPDDLQTVQILYEAAIPATVLLSKADLLGPQDRARIIEYVKQHIKSELNLDLPVRPVSVMPRERDLLAQWFANDIAPLYHQRQELKLRSVRRKIGALRQSVEFALRSRLRRKEQISPQKVEQLRDVEKELRQASGKLEEVRKVARHISDEIDVLSRKAIRKAAVSVVESWQAPGHNQDLRQVVVASLALTVEEKTEMLRRFMAALTHELHDSLESTAKVLDMKDGPSEAEFSSLLREMPAFDLGDVRFSMKRPSFVLLFGRSVSESVVANRLTKTIGSQLSSSLSAYRALLHDWAERILTQIQRRFDAYANSYRAQVERSVGAQDIVPEQEELIRRDLEAVEASRLEEPVAS